MKQWSVMFLVDATVTVVVSAGTKEEAETLAWSEVGHPTLCHQCAGEVELGDAYEISETVEVTE